MCFSIEASFAVGTALLPAGAYCVHAAARKRPRLLTLAIVPFLFGIQQIAEGFVWLGLQREDPEMVRCASLAFLFFALAFWPFWFPFMTAQQEPSSRARAFYFALATVSIAWFWVLYFPIITGPQSLLVTRVDHHSIRYEYETLLIYDYVPRNILRLLYFGCVAIPMVFAKNGLGRTPGIIFGGSAVIAAVLFHYAFVSVWCFFAAVLTGYLCRMFYRLEKVAS